LGYISELRKLIGTRPIIMAGVAVIVLNENKEILLQKRTDSFDWGTIGGAVELGENLEEAAKRELFEEAGLTSRNFKFVTILSGRDLYYKYPNGDEVYNLVSVFEAEGVEGIPTINDDEGLELRYFSMEEEIENLNTISITILKKSGYLKASG
jgi:8-oxo-dGTP pyrophosphatase MutT (NUDIX family)